MNFGSTPQAKALKNELEKLGITVISEFFDGYKNIDLVIPRAHLNIEVDGKQHYEDFHQILKDFGRTHHSDEKGFPTIHIPNSFIDNPEDLQRVANALAKAAKVRADSLGYRFHRHAYDSHHHRDHH